MKILAISDKVEELLYSDRVATRFADVDLVISCGDLPAYYLEYIVTMLNKPLYYVLGNHDTTDEPNAHATVRPAGCISIDNRVVHHHGLLIAGLQGSMRYNRRPQLQYTEYEMDAKIGRLIPRLLWNRLRTGRYLDILVTHAPPCGIHDEEDVCHRGFKGFRWFMDCFQPRYLIHGHTHRYLPHQADRTMYKHTEVINAYGYHVIDVEVLPRPAKDPMKQT